MVANQTLEEKVKTRDFIFFGIENCLLSRMKLRGCIKLMYLP